MLAQFQTRYPTGSLISELLTIYQGKFVVRVSAQVEGVTRATGMAAAETLELAEDRARERSLAVLVIDAVIADPTLQRQENNDQTSIPPEATANQLAGGAIPKQAIEVNAATPEPIFETEHQVAAASNDDSVYLSDSPVIPDAVTSADAENDRYSQELLLDSVAPTLLDPEPELAFDFETTSEIPTSSSGNPPISFSNVTPLVPRSYNSSDATQPRETLAETKTVAISEPIDLSDAIARTNVELKRLEWSNQDGRKYLEKTYGKRSRQHLTDQELLEFLHYLESLPSP